MAIDFKNGKFSPKALDFMRNSDAFLNICHGSVRSSKTVNCTLRWLRFIAEAPPGDLLMSGYTIATLQRNVLNDIIDLVGDKYFKWVNRQQGEISLLGRRIHLVGANSEDAENRIRGATLAGAYCDEVSLYPRSFIDMLITRLSVEGAKAFFNCNPGDPDHWFNKGFIENDKITNKKVWHFTLDDNPNLPAAYREALEQTYQGVFYDRMILGMWTVAEGIIYRKFAENLNMYVIEKPQTPNLAFAIISIDFGGNGAGHAFNCTGISSNLSQVITLDDYWTREEFDADQLAMAFVAFVKKQIAAGYRVREIRADGEATVLVRTVRNTLMKNGIGIPVLNAVKGKILDRITFYNTLIGLNSYKVLSHCKFTIDAFKKARWDAKHKDERLDDGTTNIDSIDAQEYATEPMQKQILDVITLIHRTVA